MDAFLSIWVTPDTGLILVVILFAVVVRAIVGFGDVLLSVPVLLLFSSPLLVVPLMGLVGATNALLMLLRERPSVQWRPVRFMLMASVFGVPVGVMLLRWLPASLINLVLGLGIIAFCIWSLLGRKTVRLDSPLWAWPFGFGAGVMGGAVTATGPPVVLYSTTQGWKPEESRATMQGFFLPNGLFILVSHWFADLWTKEVMVLYLATIPVCLVAIPMGAALGTRLSPARFEQITMLILLGAGALLVAN